MGRHIWAIYGQGPTWPISDPLGSEGVAGNRKGVAGNRKGVDGNRQEMLIP